jgi:hypothetical protein
VWIAANDVFGAGDKGVHGKVEQIKDDTFPMRFIEL